MTKEDLEEFARTAGHALGTDIWLREPGAVIQVTTYMDEKIHEVLLAYNGEQMFARISSEDDPGGGQRNAMHLTTLTG